MNNFDFWYAYYDSIFTKQKTNIHQSFIDSLRIQQLYKTQFVECKKLPSISHCFTLLQKFIHNEKNWIQSDCKTSTLEEIQKQINQIILLINVQKKYAINYWQSSKRRIQASICHFFSILNIFIYSLIPQNFNTIADASKQNKLCTKITFIENFVNDILTEMDQISKFLFQPRFIEQRQITIYFLEQIKEIFQKLPYLHKKKFKWQQKISQYLYVIIPIELFQYQYKAKVKRTKIFTNPNLKDEYKSLQNLSDQEKSEKLHLCSFRNIRPVSEIIIKQKVEKNQSFRLIKKSKNKRNKQKSIQFAQKVIKLFEFSDKVRKYSFQIQKNKINSLHTRQLRLDFQKSRKISQFANSNKQRSNEKDDTRSNTINKKKSTIFQPIPTNRSKKSSYEKFHRRVSIDYQENHRNNVQKQIKKVKTPNKVHNQYKNFHMSKATKVINFNSGKSKKWGIIQQNLQMKIVKKNIQKLIQQQI